MVSPHVLVLPFPTQGHVIPLMELSHKLVDCGFTITFVNTEFNHNRVVAALSKQGTEIHHRINLVSIPDGLAPGEDRKDLGRLCESLLVAMPGALEELICELTTFSEIDRRMWLVADQNMAWAFRLAMKSGIHLVAFWTANAASLATELSTPKLIEDGILNDDGLPTKSKMIQLSPGMPLMDTSQFAWNNCSEPEAQKIIFQYVTNNNNLTNLAEFIICNSFQELESATFAYMPNLLPIGPMIADKQFEKPVGHFWHEDAACISWLNEQPANSVIYIAFGSMTILKQHQFQELAIGLELSGQPFLWVVRPDLTNAGCDDAYPAGYRDRVGNRGKFVEWSPQQKVLAHPSIACFLTHCGWNSTLEGVRNGVPFLCWPYFCDQFLNQRYICDVWRIGLRMIPDDRGIISSEQIKLKVQELLADKDLRARALMWKERANRSFAEGGSSYMNLNSLVKAMKG